MSGASLPRWTLRGEGGTRRAHSGLLLRKGSAESAPEVFSGASLGHEGGQREEAVLGSCPGADGVMGARALRTREGTDVA